MVYGEGDDRIVGTVGWVCDVGECVVCFGIVLTPMIGGPRACLLISEECVACALLVNELRHQVGRSEYQPTHIACLVGYLLEVGTKACATCCTRHTFAP